MSRLRPQPRTARRSMPGAAGGWSNSASSTFRQQCRGDSRQPRDADEGRGLGDGSAQLEAAFRLARPALSDERGRGRAVSRSPPSSAPPAIPQANYAASKAGLVVIPPRHCSGGGQPHITSQLPARVSSVPPCRCAFRIPHRSSARPHSRRASSARRRHRAAVCTREREAGYVTADITSMAA